MRKLLQFPNHPAVVYLHWWSPSLNQGQRSFWRAPSGPYVLLSFMSRPEARSVPPSPEQVAQQRWSGTRDVCYVAGAHPPCLAVHTHWNAVQLCRSYMGAKLMRCLLASASQQPVSSPS